MRQCTELYYFEFQHDRVLSANLLCIYFMPFTSSPMFSHPSPFPVFSRHRLFSFSVDDAGRQAIRGRVRSGVAADGQGQVQPARTGCAESAADPGTARTLRAWIPGLNAVATGMNNSFHDNRSFAHFIYLHQPTLFTSQTFFFLFLNDCVLFAYAFLSFLPEIARGGAVGSDRGGGRQTARRAPGAGRRVGTALRIHSPLSCFAFRVGTR